MTIWSNAYSVWITVSHRCLRAWTTVYFSVSAHFSLWTRTFLATFFIASLLSKISLDKKDYYKDQQKKVKLHRKWRGLDISPYKQNGNLKCLLYVENKKWYLEILIWYIDGLSKMHFSWLYLSCPSFLTGKSRIYMIFLPTWHHYINIFNNILVFNWFFSSSYHLLIPFKHN